jgi:peroxiredoxin
MPRHSTMLALKTSAPQFALPDTRGKTRTLEEFAASPALLVAFICNHCPYVKHILDGFVRFARDYAPKGVAVVAISSNDVESYPQDAPAAMARLAADRGFGFPYLFDETQAVARAYQAVCTPDFFLFDCERRLAYRGQFDSSRPGSKAPVTGADLRVATEAMLSGRPLLHSQVPSTGCGIKWKPGNAPDDA